MLTYFKVEGFKKFEKGVAINFENVRDYKFNTECIKDGVIKNAIIYGKNATGKSSLGLAILDISFHINYDVSSIKSEEYLNWNNNIAKFEYKFNFDGKILEYSYSKVSASELRREKIVLDDEVLMDYDYENKSGDFVGLNKIKSTLNLKYEGDGSIFSYILNNITIDTEHPLYKFKQFVSKMIWFRTLDKTQFVAQKNINDDYFKFIFEPGAKEEFEEFLKKSGVEEKLLIKLDNEGKQALFFEKNSQLLNFFSVASSGTKALYTFFYWNKTVRHASFIYLDEFDAYYHHELAENIIEMIKQMNNTQSIFTTHNTNLLTNNIMRPDCYFILSEKLIAFCDATQRELRQGHNLEKLYKAGEFNVD